MTRILAAMTAALMLAACATTSPASPVRIDVSAVRPLSGMAGATVDVTATNTGPRLIGSLAVICQFFDAAGASVNTAATFFNGLAAGASDTNGVIVPTLGVVRGACAVRQP